MRQFCEATIRLHCAKAEKLHYKPRGEDGLQIERCSANGMIVFVLGVITGTVMTVVVKVLYEVEAIGMDGARQPFEKPLLGKGNQTISETFS